MFKVIFYQVAYNHIMVGNRLHLMPEYSIEKNREQFKLDRASMKPLFDCYCVNQFQVDKIKKALEKYIKHRGPAYTYFVGYKILVQWRNKE